MTVADLIAALEKYPKEMEVVIDGIGCGCCAWTARDFKMSVRAPDSGEELGETAEALVLERE